MSDDVVDGNEPATTDAPGLSRKERNAARRAEFEAQKSAKLEEKAAAKRAKSEARASAKAEKEQARSEKKTKKNSKTKTGKKAAKGHDEDASELTVEDAGHGFAEKTSSKPEKAPKDPYRPRFATAPSKVRAFAVLGFVFSFVHVLVAVLLFLETTASPVLGVLPDDAPSVGYLGASVSALVAVLWASSVWLLCAGRLLGKRLGVVSMVLGLPLSVVVVPLLFSGDVRDWAL